MSVNHWIRRVVLRHTHERSDLNAFLYARHSECVCARLNHRIRRVILWQKFYGFNIIFVHTHTSKRSKLNAFRPMRMCGSYKSIFKPDFY